MSKNIFGSNLKRLRLEKNMTQQQLADKIMISTANICRWEKGDSYPQIIWVYIIAKALEVNPEELIILQNTKKR